MGDKIDQAATGFMRRDLTVCLGWGDGSMACLFFKLTFFLLFLSLSSSVCEFGNHLKVKQKHK